MDLKSVIEQVQAIVPDVSDVAIIAEVEASGVQPELFTAGHVQSIANRLRGGVISTKSKAPGSGLAVKAAPKLAKRPTAPIAPVEAPTFAAQSPIDTGLAAAKANAQAVGYNDVAELMAAQRQGYAEGAELAWEEGVEQFSTFRESIYSGITEAMLS